MPGHDIMTIEDSLATIEVRALELQPPLVLTGDASVTDAIHAMRDSGLGYALIAEKGQLTGIFTERDVFLRVLDQEETLRLPVSERMTAAPTSVRETDPVWQVVALMHEALQVQ